MTSNINAIALLTLIIFLCAVFSARAFWHMVRRNLILDKNDDVYMSRIKAVNADGSTTLILLEGEDKNPDGVHAALLEEKDWETKAWQYVFCNCLVSVLLMSVVVIALTYLFGLADMPIMIFAAAMTGLACGPLAAVPFDWGWYSKGRTINAVSMRIESGFAKYGAIVYNAADAFGKVALAWLIKFMYGEPQPVAPNIQAIIDKHCLSQ